MIGTGLYTLGEIATFTQIPALQLRRWLRGYRSGHKTYPPLWASELSDSPLPQALGFHDLLEVRVVHAFRQYGVSLPTDSPRLSSRPRVFQAGLSVDVSAIFNRWS
jgi:hypothetical protein